MSYYAGSCDVAVDVYKRQEEDLAETRRPELKPQ